MPVDMMAAVSVVWSWQVPLPTVSTTFGTVFPKLKNHLSDHTSEYVRIVEVDV
jgi:ribulose bisphosphate carboxylase small subunit